MSWRALIWIAGSIVVMLLVGSLGLAVVTLRSLWRQDGRRAWRILTLLLSMLVVFLGAYSLWFAWPMFSGRRPMPKDPVLAQARGELFSRGGLSIMVLAAHPDDVEWYCGGTLARALSAGSKVTVVVATHGERGRGAPDPGALSAIRRREQEEAARIIGYTRVVFLDIPDREVSQARDLKPRVAALWDEVRPDVVLTFDAVFPARPYVHPDHQAVGRAVLELLSEKRVQPAVAYLFSSSSPDAAVDITPFVERKLAAIHAHRTQFGETGGRGAIEQNNASGKVTGITYAEIFRVIEPSQPVRNL